jgi:predicted GH43/DUF377 family glycosyl hydrolase
MNSLAAFRLNEDHTPQVGFRVRCKGLFDREHFEDPRAIYHNSRTYISCCNFIVYPNAIKEKWTGAHICVQVIEQSPDNWTSTKRIDPVYGNNEGTLAVVKGLEKNWVWFFHKNELHLIYGINPHITVKWSEDFRVVQEWKEQSDIAEWGYGHLRGGTPPILHEGLYWSFFHSSLPLQSKYRRRYYMGAYAFEPFPPFNIVKFTKEPLLAGSDEDDWAEKKPLVVFPCGAVMKDNQWLVSIGVNDLLSAWVEVPHQDLLIKMGEKPLGMRRWLADSLKPTSTGVIAYLPPPNVGNTQIFLKNLQDHPPACTPQFISEYPWPDAERIPDPTKKHEGKDKIACYVFLQALELAEKRGWDAFIYLETDCRVSGVEWDKALFAKFYSASNGTVAGGNLAIFGAENGPLIFKAKLAQVTHLNGTCRHDQSADSTKVLYQGLPTDKTVVFVNGAPAVYSVKALRDVFGHGSIESIVERMKSSDLSIGEMHGDMHGVSHSLSRFLHMPEIMATGGETIYPFAVRKHAIESGEVRAVHPVKNRWRPKPNGIPSFYHSGDLGDIVYSLKAIQLYTDSARLVLGSKCYSKFPPRSPMTKEVFDLFAPLLEQQPYLASVAYSATWQEWDYDMNDFRTLWNERAHDTDMRTLCQAHCTHLGVEPLYNQEPWLVAETNRISKIIIHRSARYHAQVFPWVEIVQRFGKDLLFIGLPDEHAAFCKEFGMVKYFKPIDFGQMAANINGADWFIGNQSMPCSIALGLGVKVWQETWLNSPDCVFDRPGLFYNGLSFPEGLQ